MATFSTRKRALYTAALLLFLWGLTELACWAGLWALQRKGLEYKPSAITDLDAKNRGSLEAHLSETDSYMMFDAELGWTVRPSAQKSIYRSNGRGLRADREYSEKPPADRVRVAAFGDSFTHASGVPNGSTWEDVLERLQPGLEVLNFGIPGSDPGQGLLRYRREGTAFQPAVVLIGMMSENIKRMVNTFRPFYFSKSGIPFSKPRFEVRDGRLALIPNPLRSLDEVRALLRDPERMLPRLGRHDYFYQRYHRRSRFDFLPSVRFFRVVGDQYFDQPILVDNQYNVRSEAYAVSLGVLRQFYAEAHAHGSLPVIVLFPQRADVMKRRSGRPTLYQPLLDQLRRDGLRVLDLGDGFARYDPQGKISKKKFIHYPPDGNDLVGRTVGDYLQEQGLLTPEGVRAAYAKTRTAPPAVGGS